MNRGQFKQYILETYPCEANHPWIKYPNNEVFRHPGNRKWFALVMDVPKNKLGLAGSDVIDVVNLKCDPILIGLPHEQGKLDLGCLRRQCAGRTDQNAAGYELWRNSAQEEKESQEKLMPLKGGVPKHEAAHLHRNRPQEFLRFGGMPGARA